MKTVWWENDKVCLIDQTKLPLEETVIQCGTVEEVAHAIRTLQVRGAPAIGVTAAYGVALAAALAAETEHSAKQLDEAIDLLASTRPTAVNLFWALEKMKEAITNHDGNRLHELHDALLVEAERIAREDIESCRTMGRFGAELLPENAVIITHCNAGSLATAGYGTALGVIRAAHELGKVKMVYADETRPLLQGARLTAWELSKEGIPCTLMPDSAAGSLLRNGEISAVVVGADRIASNGDAANKIGTYPLSVMAREHGVPFYVAAPLSTIDFNIKSGLDIPIEERDGEEIACLYDTRIAPHGICFYNPAFDVTPAENIAAIFTEKGVLRPPYTASIAALRS